MPILKWGHSWSVKIAVVAHAKKKLGGGLPELRTELRRRGHAEVVWREVMKSKKVPDAVRAAVAADPDLLLLWRLAACPGASMWAPSTVSGSA